MTMDAPEAGASRDSGTGAEPFTYAFHPRLGGAGVTLTLEGDILHWTAGPRAGALPLSHVAEVNLLFSPAKFAAASFEARIRARSGEKVLIGSASRTSLTAVSDQGPAYAAFVRALHARLAEAGRDVSYRAGYAPWRWWLMTALAVIAVLGLVAVVMATLLTGAWLVAAVLLVLLLFMGEPMANQLVRNRPGSYRPDALPSRLMPKEHKAP